MADHDLNDDHEQEQQVKQPPVVSDPNRKLRYYTPHEVAVHNQAQVCSEPEAFHGTEHCFNLTMYAFGIDACCI